MESRSSQENGRGSNDILSDLLSPLSGHSTTVQHPITQEEEVVELHARDEANGDDTNGGKESSDTHTSVKRSRTSEVWNHFKLVKDKDGKERGICNYCQASFKAESSVGTSSLQRHLNRSCKEYKKLKSNENSSLGQEIDQKVFRRLLAEALIRHGYSFSWVEHEATRKVFKYLNDKVEPVTRNTIQKDCVEMHAEMKEKILHVFEGLPGKICLTCDLWSACTSRGYLCVTAHYIDENWMLNSKVLCFKHVAPPHSGYELSVELGNVAIDWGIHKKIFSLTVDNASNMDKMVFYLKGGSFRDLLYKGKYFHVRCAAHILNLVVHSGLKLIGTSISKLREGIKYIEGSEGRKIKFLEVCKQIDTSYSGGLWLDVATRWNSTYMMLERALKYREVLNHYFSESDALAADYLVGEDEWEKIVTICHLLEPFYKITNMFSGREYPTVNLYFPQVFVIYSRLQHAMRGENGADGSVIDPEIVVVAAEMMVKFQKYWEDYVPVLAFAVVFDPQRKFTYVKFAFSRTHGEFHGGQMANNIRRELDGLYKEYEKSASVGENEPSGRENLSQAEMHMQNFEDFDLYDPCESSKSELEVYLDEPRYKISDDFDVLSYWRTNSTRFPILSKMARDLLAIPVTTVASESTFSMGGRILNKWRSSLTDDNID